MASLGARCSALRMLVPSIGLVCNRVCHGTGRKPAVPGPAAAGERRSRAPGAPVPGEGRALPRSPALAWAAKRSGSRPCEGQRVPSATRCRGGRFPRGTCRRLFQSTGQKPGTAGGTADAELPEEVGKKGKKSGERDQMSRRSLPAPCSAPWTGWLRFGTVKLLLLKCSLI